VGGACWWLEPLQARLAGHGFESTKLFADDTPIPVLDPGRGRTKTGRLWAYARDDRPWSGARTAGRRLLLQSRSQGRASCRSSPGLPWCAASRWLCWLRAADRAGRPYWRRAEPTHDASSTICTKRPAHRSPPRPCDGSPNSMRSRDQSRAAPQMRVNTFVTPAPGRSPR
jgi:Transposase IS66 family